MGELADRQSCRGSTCHLAEATNPSAIGLAAAVFRLPSPLKQPLRGGKLSPWVLFRLRLRLQRGGDEIESFPGEQKYEN